MAKMMQGSRVRIALAVSLVAIVGCGGGVELGEAVIKAPSGCPEIQIRASGDVELCHHAYAHWTGSELERNGDPLFVVNRGQITASGHVVVKQAGDGIDVFVAEGGKDRHIRIEESGAVVDGDGQKIAKITPAPAGDIARLVFAALIREGIWLPELPPTKPARVDATKSQTIGAPKDEEKPRTPCACNASE